MASRANKIDIEWANSLVGLPLKIPDNWWVGYTGSYLHDGKLVAFDVVNRKWCFELDDQDDDDHYLIAYDAVCEYSNKQHSTFNRYQLPSELVLEGDDEIETEDGTLYSLTPTAEWSRVDDNQDGGRTIDPIEWMGGDEEFSINITDAEINSLKDENGEIRYEKVFEWALPRFGSGDDELTLFEFQAARMRNYMRKRMVEDGWTPKYYTGNRVITADHVTRFYGACLAKMFMGNRSINQIFCTREIFNAVPSIQASMTKNAMEDLTSCLHYSDDWELMGDGIWSDTYDDPKVIADPFTAVHRLKHGRLEDGYNKVCTVCCCCCCYYDSNRFLTTFFPFLFFFFLKAVASYS
jgi:hypothetical protein